MVYLHSRPSSASPSSAVSHSSSLRSSSVGYIGVVSDFCHWPCQDAHVIHSRQGMYWFCRSLIRSDRTCTGLQPDIKGHAETRFVNPVRSRRNADARPSQTPSHALLCTPSMARQSQASQSFVLSERPRSFCVICCAVSIPLVLCRLRPRTSD